MMPTIFVGHGNPMYAIQQNGFTENWRKIGKQLQKPKAIVVISAHWETVGTFVTNSTIPRTIHDFYGFPPQLFEVEYRAKGHPRLASEISRKVTKTEVKLDDNWGLDHGTWAVLNHIYPEADIPTIQISLDRTKSPKEHFEFAKELRFLRNEEILIIGSGNIVHNLTLINFRNPIGNEWANSANEILKQLVLTNDFNSLINFQNLGSEVHLAIPTPEHFLPLLYILALKTENEKIDIFNDVVELGAISMTSFKFG